LPAEEQRFPAEVDSNSPSFWVDGVFSVFNSTGKTFLSTGSAVQNLADPVEVTLPRPDRPGSAWIEAIWREPDTGVLYGWYHFEPGDIGCLTAPIIGAAMSFDGGRTWEDRGFVLENPHGIDCDFVNGFFVGGNGDFSVILGPEGKYFFFMFSNYIGPAKEVGIGMARSSVQDRGQPGTLSKLYQGSWTEPGIGGLSTAIFKSTTGWSGPVVDAYWGPSIHWNEYLKVYVVLMNRTYGTIWEQEGIYIAFSSDLTAWTAPLKILETSSFYPQIVGLGANGTDTLGGQEMRIFVHGVSNFVLSFER
jgi:hypothetical protein